MKSLIVGGLAAAGLLATVGLASAQTIAPENRPSTTMQRDGGHSDMAIKQTHGRGTPRYLHLGRSVGVSHHRLYRRHGRHYVR